MPNWVDNELYIRGAAERLAQVRETLEAQDSLLSFRKVVPQPEGYDYVISPAPATPSGEIPYSQLVQGFSTTADVETYLIEFLKTEKVTCDSIGVSQKTKAHVSYLSAFLNKMYGYPTWYEWCYANWGTKWDASRVERVQTKSSLRYRFTTAWSQPIPIIQRLIATNPDLEFVAKAWDGGAGWKQVIRGTQGAMIRGAREKYRGRRGG